MKGVRTVDKYCERCYARDAKPCMECSTCNPGHHNFRSVPTLPPTNGDRIRARTDEEMADFIVEDCLDGKIHFCKNKPECREILEQNECIPTEMCRQCALDWLRQPAEGSENK